MNCTVYAGKLRNVNPVLKGGEEQNQPKFPLSGVKLRKCYDGTISKVKSYIKVDPLKALQNIDLVTYNLKINYIYQILSSFLWQI